MLEVHFWIGSQIVIVKSWIDLTIFKIDIAQEFLLSLLVKESANVISLDGVTFMWGLIIGYILFT